MVLGSLENNPSPRAQHTVGQIDRAKASAVRRLRRHVDGIYKGNLASLANLIYDSRNPCAIDWKHSISVEDGGPILVGMIGPERVHSKQALEKIMAHLRSYLDEYEQQLTKSLP